MKKILFFLMVFILSTSFAHAWTKDIIHSRWDRSMVYSSEHPDGQATGDQVISSWQGDEVNSDEIRILFASGRIPQITIVYKNGIRTKEHVSPSYFRASPRCKIYIEMVNEIAKTVWDKFGESVISIGYTPQFGAMSMYLNVSRWHDIELNKKIAAYLESMRKTKYNYWMKKLKRAK